MSKKDEENTIIAQSVVRCRNEAEESKRERMRLNERNFDFYHLRQDYSHKKAGQSREFLPKQSMAVEQITSFVHQGLVDFGDWYSVNPSRGNKDPLVSSAEARCLLSRQLDKAEFFTFIQDALKSGLLGSVMIAKVHGEMVNKPEYRVEKKRRFLGTEKVLKKRDKKHWQLKIDLVRQQDYYPDPTGEGLYEIQVMEMDYYKLLQMAEADPETYNVDAVRALKSSTDIDSEASKNRETGQTNTQDKSARKRVSIVEYWGTILDMDGNVLHENAVVTLADETTVIRGPEANPFWHGESPFVTAPLFRVPHSVWHRSLMDAPTALNQSMNELYNLILDSGIMSVFGVRQIRESWIDNVDEIENGILPGMTLKVNSSCPPGQKVLETVSTGTLSQEALSVLNLTSAEFSASALTNDLRMGVLPQRAVKATEVVEASQSITSVFTGVSKTIEKSFIEPILERAWLTFAQNADDLDSADVIAEIGEVRARELAAVSKEDRFQRVVNGHDFRVFGLTQTLNKMKDFRKLTTLLQTIGSAGVLTEEFTRKYDIAKLLTEIMKSLDVDTDKISHDDIDAAISANAEAQTAPGAPQPAANDQSNITQMAGTTPESAQQGAAPKTDMAH